MDTGVSSLVFHVGAHVCAIPIAHVTETMRPLPIEPIGGAPSCVLGIARIRGVAVPVIDVGALVGGSTQTTANRFVAIRVDGRSVALAVDSVEGVTTIDAGKIERMPPVLRSSDAIDGIAPLDDRLLMVLRTARLVSDRGPA
jgi:purine-binding chemotaxis protein CheW